MNIIPRISVWTVRRVFKFRYGLASFTRRSRVFNAVVERVMFRGDDMILLPKDDVVRSRSRTVETDISVDSAGERTILPSQVAKEIVSRAGEDIFIMNFCLCRLSSKCGDYPIENGCIFMGKGVHRIPPEYGRMATVEEAHRYLDRCADLGLVHIVGRNRLDSMWLNTGKTTDLMTLCNCCPCCCLWNMVRDISDEIGSQFRRMTGVELNADPSRCDGCGTCTEWCFTTAISVTDGGCSVDDSLCRGCGRCVEVCPQGALTLTFDESAVGTEIDRISSLVNLSGNPL